MFERLDHRLDVLAQVVEAVYVGSVLSSRMELKAPWALHYSATSRKAGFHAVVNGSCYLSVDGSGELIQLGEGDVVILPHGVGHVLCDTPGTAALELQDLVADIAPGARIDLPFGVGNSATLLCGSYSFAAGESNLLLRGLPNLLHVPADQTKGGVVEATVKLLSIESESMASGSSIIVDRLVDLLFVYALRTWLTHTNKLDRTSWFSALDAPVVGPALRAIHDDPSRRWTVADLAAEAGASRAAFARRFSKAIGEPPLAYTTRWRMTVAARLLERGDRIASVAQQVGYENEFAFAKAFKRLRGIAPGRFRSLRST